MRRLAAVLLVPMLLAPLAPAASAAACNTTYPLPRLSLRGDHSLARPETSPRLEFGGYLVHDRCPLAGRAVGLFTRSRPGPFTFAAKTVTSASGRYTTTLPYRGALDVLAIF